MLVDWEGTIACSLMLLSDGDWETVHADPRYLTWVQSRLDARGHAGLGCGDYPGVGKSCTVPGCAATGQNAVGGTPVILKNNVKNSLQRDVLVPQLEAWAEAHPDEG